jgi:mannose/fructose/N-acetylgalactosamine-specific phosphotransferase system component IIC
MSRRNKLDKALLVLGYFAATFILVISVMGIYLAIIKLFNSRKTIMLPQAQADTESKLIPDRSVVHIFPAERQKNKGRKEEIH